MTAAARHAIRVIAHWNPDPVDVLAKANEVILAGDRFSQDDLRDDMTILVARVTTPAGA
jgi:hypothetical protein